MKIHQKAILSVSLVSLMLALSGCGGSNSDPDPTPEPRPNIAPTASASDDQSHDEGDLVTLDGSGSSDSDGTISSFKWTQTAGTLVTLSDSTVAKPTFTAPSVSADETLTFSLTVTDNASATATDSIDILVKNKLLTGLLEPKGVEEITLDGVVIEAAADEILVYLNDDVTPGEYSAIIAKLIAEGADPAGYDPALKIIQVKLPSSLSEEVLISAVADMAGLGHAGLNEVVEPSYLTEKDNAAGYENRPPVPAALTARSLLEDTPAFDGSYWIDHISADKAWNFLEGKPLEEVTIGIVDTGISAEQESIAETRLQRFDILSDGTVATTSDDDTKAEASHGEWVSSFAAAHNVSDGKTLYGVNHYANVVHSDVYKKRCELSTVIGDCPFGIGIKTFVTDLLRGGKEAIDQGSSAVNISWGDGSKCENTSEVRLKSRRNWRAGTTSLVQYAKQKDALLLFSAGNNCEKADNQLLTDIDDIAQDPWKTNALIVAATDSDKKDASFSRMGDVVNIAAPGHSIGWGNGETGSGTSYSTPLVTGAAGLVEAMNTSLMAPEVRHILLSSSDNSVVLSDAAKDAGATGPIKMLNVHGAVQTADLTRGIELDILDKVSLNKDEMKDVEIKLTLPDTTVTAVDVMFLIDVSGSYGDDIATLKTQADSIITGLKGRGINVAFGVSAFSDFPIPPYGSLSAGDEAFYLLQGVTTDEAVAKEGINALTTYSGNDSAESQLEGLYQSITGKGRDINGDGDFDDAGDLKPSSVGWRDGALKVVLLATDASFHDSDTETDYPGAGRTEVISKLKEAGATVFGLQSGGSSSSTTDIESITFATGGQSFELSYDSSEIATAISDALDVALAKIDITPEVIAGQEWITNISPESFEDVLPGSEITFSLSLKGIKNNPSGLDPLNYDLILWFRGDGSAVLKRVRIPVEVSASGS